MSTLSSSLSACVLLLSAGAAVFYWDQPPVASKPTATAESTPAHRYAPEGTFYLLRYASVRTPKGMYGFAPGCKMRLLGVNEAKRTLRVTNGQQSAEIDPSLLTNDLDVADAVRHNDESDQSALVDPRQQQRAYQESHLDAYIAQAEDAHAAEVAHNAAAGIASRTNHLNEPAQPAGGYYSGYGYPYGYNR